VIANAAFMCDKNFVITNITKNPVLRNPMLTAVDAVFTCDTDNITKNPALLISIITKVTNDPPTLGIGATTINKPFSFLAKVTNLVSVPNNVIIDDLMCIIGLTIYNIIFTVKPNDVLAYNLLIILLAQNTNITLKQDYLLMLIYNKDAPFKFNNKTLLNVNVLTKQDNTLASSIF
jgi:hypothetical protein